MNQITKKQVVFGMVVLLLLVFGVSASFGGGAANAVEAVTKGSLAVKGQGKVTAKPDMAFISVGVTTQNKTAVGAQSENNQKMESVMTTLKGLGLAEVDIRTTSYDLSPRYDYITSKTGEQKQQLNGYVATNQVQVTIRNINAVGKVLDAVVNSGANLAGGVAFTLSEAKSDAAYAQALGEALKNARSKADVLAKGLGISLGTPKEVTEGGGYVPPLYNQGYYGAKMAEAAVPVAPGQMEISASVGLRYEY